MSQISIQGPAKISFFIEACVGLFVLRKVKCADPYIFYTGVHACTSVHTHDQDSMSFTTRYRDEQKLDDKLRATLKRMTVSKNGGDK